MSCEYPPPTGLNGRPPRLKTVGFELRSARAQLAASEDFVAAALGLSVEDYRRVEDGTAQLNPSRVIQAAQLFGLQPSALCMASSGGDANAASTSAGPADVVDLASARRRRQT